MKLALHPKYSFYWESISIDELLLLQKELVKRFNTADTGQAIQHFKSPELDYQSKLKDILERLGVVHSLKNDGQLIVLNDMNQVNSLYMLLYQDKNNIDVKQLRTKISTHDYVFEISGITVKQKFASSIAVPVGRPEKAAERKMKPPVHVLFPVGNKGGATERSY